MNKVIDTRKKFIFTTKTSFIICQKANVTNNEIIMNMDTKWVKVK